MDDRPLVLTLALADADQQRFDRLRRTHFPADRNHLGAHVTLFHALPGAAAQEVAAEVAAAAHRPAFDVAVTGVRLLGRGVAYTLASEELAAVHARVRRGVTDALGDVLTPQDRQGLRPHVTVQNKVAPERARALHADLAAGFAPGTVAATGLALWRYAGGPWEPSSTHPFTG